MVSRLARLHSALTPLRQGAFFKLLSSSDPSETKLSPSSLSPRRKKFKKSAKQSLLLAVGLLHFFESRVQNIFKLLKSSTSEAQQPYRLKSRPTAGRFFLIIFVRRTRSCSFHAAATHAAAAATHAAAALLQQQLMQQHLFCSSSSLT